MPHIHRIRVNNVKYNFGTQFYDDFILRFDGKNALYDLANGGGKSVLMLLLFQNLIPNCTLDDKQPIEKLFRTSDGSTSIHSLIEWRLDEADVVDGYKYMLTGFCARKAKDDGDEVKVREAAAIDYFNYVIFYREYNDNDLVNLPLSKGKERMTYIGLRTYLKELEHKDYSLKIHIFDRKGAYQSFISRYGLYESQWEIIRGINKTEGHVRAYFESNYKTTRKVVEELLIEEIIQNAYAQKTDGGDEDMAGTLMAIRGKLLELSKKRRDILSYDRQTQALESFSGRVASLKKLYRSEEDFRYALVRAYNGVLDAVKVKTREGAVLSKEQTFTEKHMQEIERKLDTVKVQKTQAQLKSLENDSSKLEEGLEALEADYGRAAMDLAEAECMRDFLEYEENAKAAEVLRTVLAKNDGEPQGYLKQLKNLAGLGKNAIDEKREEILGQVQKVKENVLKLEDVLSKKQTLLEQVRMSAAVTDSDIDREKQEETQLMAEISKLRRQVNALFIEGTSKELQQFKTKEEKLGAQFKAAAEETAALKAQMQQLSLEIEQNHTKISAGAYRKQTMADFFDTYGKMQKKADGLLKVYGAEDYDSLKQNIYGRYKKAAQDIYISGQHLEMLAESRRQLAEKNPVPVSEGVISVMEYVRRCYNASCIAGADYLKDVSSEEKTALLEAMPYLPYAVIVRSAFDKIAGDDTFKAVNFGANQVVLVSYDAVVSGEKLSDDTKLIFTSRDKALFTDEDAIGREIQRVDKAIAKCESLRKRLLDQETTYRDDLDYVYYFIDAYYGRRLEFLSGKDAFEKEMAACRQKIHELTGQLETAKAQVSSLKKTMEDLENEIADIARQRSAVEDMSACNDKLYEVQKLLRGSEQKKKALDSQIKTLAGDIEKVQAERLQAHRQLETYEKTLETLKQLWQTLFFTYYDEKFVPDMLQASDKIRKTAEETSETADEMSETSDTSDGEKAGKKRTVSELEVKFRALKQAYESENSDMEDKKKLLETYEKTMARLEENIVSRNMTLKEVAEKKAKGIFVACDKSALCDIRQKMEELQQEIRLQKAMAKDALENKHKLTGRVENAVSVIEEKYGYYKEVQLKNMDYDGFVQAYNENLHGLKEKMRAISVDTDKNFKELRILEDIKKDMERLMRSVAVTIAYTKDCDRNDENFRQKFAELSESYERLKKDEALKKAEFEKDKDKLVETLRLVKAYELADEIHYQVTLPQTEAEALALTENISDMVKIIMLEKARIEKGIEDMKKIKANFESQCIQRCTDIKMELDRLPKMSKITLGDEHIQMLSLKIPYVKEAFYSERMSQYIDRIVEKSDAIGEEGERLKYLRNQLAWKNLFSVIVTDMDQIRLSLYKRERIREQSRFLKYEEAVGSTGQSQGIYIQFLIAVINYISALHSHSSDTSALKKVIFIDNPFGAAKDIYIWEPIFALLKENHVQLIVPARGATPAITGKFDVNYVLGQKVIGTRQQTVVIDYHSNVDIQSMEYRAIEFEQQVFDFV